MNHELIDCFIVVAPNAVDNLSSTINMVKKNVSGIGNISIITANGVLRNLPSEIRFLDELKIGIDKELIIQWFINNNHNISRVNWYFQQFLKIIACNYSSTNYFLIWDGDTIPLNKIKLIDYKNGFPTICYRPTDEFHRPYFVTNKKLLNIGRISDSSFISEYCVVNKQICKELVERIANTGPNEWYINILDSISPKDVNNSGFSEYELIGNFQILNGLKYSTFGGSSFRKASSYFGPNADPNLLFFLSHYYTFVSFERWGVASKLKANFFNAYPILAIAHDKSCSLLRSVKRYLLRVRGLGFDLLH